MQWVFVAVLQPDYRFLLSAERKLQFLTLRIFLKASFWVSNNKFKIPFLLWDLDLNEVTS